MKKVFATDETTLEQFQVDADFRERVQQRANEQANGRRAEYYRDLAARDLGFSCYAEYAQSVEQQQIAE